MNKYNVPFALSSAVIGGAEVAVANRPWCLRRASALGDKYYKYYK